MGNKKTETEKKVPKGQRATRLVEYTRTHARFNALLLNVPLTTRAKERRGRKNEVVDDHRNATTNELDDRCGAREPKKGVVRAKVRSTSEQVLYDADDELAEQVALSFCCFNLMVSLVFEWSPRQTTAALTAWPGCTLHSTLRGPRD